MPNPDPRNIDFSEESPEVTDTYIGERQSASISRLFSDFYSQTKREYYPENPNGEEMPKYMKDFMDLSLAKIVRMCSFVNNNASALIEYNYGIVAKLEELEREVNEDFELFVKNNKARRSAMSEAETAFYDTMKASKDGIIKDTVKKYDSLKKCLRIVDRYVSDYASGAEEEKTVEQFGRIGLFGTRPSIDECLNMSIYDGDIDSYFERYLWLCHTSQLHESRSNRDPKGYGKARLDESVYGYAYRKFWTEIISAPHHLQAEIAVRILRQRNAINDRLLVKYEEILRAVPDDPEILKGMPREDYAKLLLSQTAEFSASESISLAVSGYGGSIIGSVISAAMNELHMEGVEVSKTNPELGNKIDPLKRPSAAMAALANGDLFSLREEYRKSNNHFSAEIDRLELTRAEKEQTALGIRTTDICNQLARISKPYHDIITDTRDASDSFNRMRAALKVVFANENSSNTEVTLSNLQNAIKQIKAYRQSHSGHRISTQGKERIAWASELDESLTEILEIVSKTYRKEKTQEARDAFKAAFNAIKSDNKELRPANPEGMMKEAYAQILYQHIKRLNAADPQHEAAEFRAFRNSMAFKAAFMNYSPAALEKLLDNPDPAKLDADIITMRENAFLDKVPRRNAEKYLTNLHHADITRNKGLYFENLTEDYDISEIMQNPSRLELSYSRSAYTSMAIGQMLLSGCSLKEIMNPYELTYERREAGRAVLSAFNGSDKEFAEYAAKCYHEAMKKGIEYLNSRLSEPGMIPLSIDKLTDPKNSDIFTTMVILQDAGQELEKRAVMEAAAPLFDDCNILLDNQKNLNAVLANIKNNCEKTLKNVVKYDINSGIQMTDIHLTENDSIGAIFSDKEQLDILNRIASDVGPQKDFLTSINENFDQIIAEQNAATIAFTDLANPILSDGSHSARLRQPGVLSAFSSAVLYGQYPDQFSIEIDDSGTLQVQEMDALIKQSESMAKLEKEQHELMQSKAKGVAQNEMPQEKLEVKDPRINANKRTLN